MVLKNYYKMLQMHTGATVKVVSTNGTEINCSYTRENYGSENYYGYLDSFGFYGMKNPAATSYTMNRVVFGNGNVEPKIDDYKLSGHIITGISTTVSNTVSLDGEDAVQSSVFTITNNNNDDITISEVAYCGKACSTTSGSGVGLFERTLLESPITIPAGGVGQVTYTIRMNYPVE